MKADPIFQLIVDTDENGSAYRSENTHEYPKYSIHSEMVQAVITKNGHTPQHAMPTWTIIAYRYIKEVLIPHVRLLGATFSDIFHYSFHDKAT